MTVKDLIDVMENSDRIQVIENGNTIYCGYIGLMEHDQIEKKIKESKVKKAKVHLDISHKDWKKKGLREPMKTEEMKDYVFEDLQLSVYNDIYI